MNLNRVCGVCEGMESNNIGINTLHGFAGITYNPLEFPGRDNLCTINLLKRLWINVRNCFTAYCKCFLNIEFHIRLHSNRTRKRLNRRNAKIGRNEIMSNPNTIEEAQPRKASRDISKKLPPGVK